MNFNDRDSMLDYLLAGYEGMEEYPEMEARFEAMTDDELRDEIEAWEEEMSHNAIYEMWENAH